LRPISSVSMASLISGTLMLSIQPHQEARFLLPLALPLTILCSRPTSKSRSSNFRRMFWLLHLLHSVITVALFGYLHQGGIQSALENIPSETKILLSYKTFDVPTALITGARISKIDNLRGAGEDVLVRALCESVRLDEARQLVLLAPRWALRPELEDHFRLLFSSAMPHLDLDRLAHIFNAGPHRYGIGLYTIHPQTFRASELC